MKKLYIIRGLPGSGKTTLGRLIAQGGPLYEADQFFTDEEGNYRFDATKIADAHRWCKLEAGKSRAAGYTTVVVANTFTRHWEYALYLDLAQTFGYSVTIITTKGNHGSVHGVPRETMDNMRERWEN